MYASFATYSKLTVTPSFCASNAVAICSRYASCSSLTATRRTVISVWARAAWPLMMARAAATAAVGYVMVVLPLASSSTGGTLTKIRH